MTCETWQVEAAEVRPAIDGTMRRRFGAVQVDLVDDGHAIVGTVVPMDVDAQKLQLDRAPDNIVTLDVLAPFPVRVDRTTRRVLPDALALPPRAWPLVAGLRVRQGAREAVIATVEHSRVTLRNAACKPEAIASGPAVAWSGSWLPWTGLAVLCATATGLAVRSRRFAP